MRPALRRLTAPRPMAAFVLLPALLLSACGGESGSGEPTSTSAASSEAAATATTDLGITVTGGFGDKPTVTVPTEPAPAELRSEVLVEGTGPPVAEGDKVFVDYLGQTWAPKDGKVNVFDNSYDRGEAFNFVIGQGDVIAGWDNGLLGLEAGTRVLLAVPAKDAYGEEKVADKELSGEALVFVVDVIGGVAMTASADGTPTTSLPAGLPTVTSQPGKEPSIASVEGVKAPAAGEPALSALLLEGTGEAIDTDGRVALQFLQTDAATGEQTQKTWGGEGPQLVPAETVIATVPALKDAKVGSRAVVVTAPSDQQPSLVVVVDVVAQF